MTKKSDKEKYARPYADLKTPFTVDKNGAFAEYIVQNPESMPDIALGATVIIADKLLNKLFWIAGQIVGLRAISPFSPERENLLYIEPGSYDPIEVLEEVTGPHTHQPMIIRVSLEREMWAIDSGDRKFNSFPIQRPPSAFSRLYFPNITPVKDDPSPSLLEILNIKSNGVTLGCVGFGNSPYERDGSFLEYKLDVEHLDNKHMFVVGESGSGKTVFLKTLAYELRRLNQNNRILMTDLQGDIIQFLLSDVASKLVPRGWQANVEMETAEQVDETMKDFQLIIPARKGVLPSDKVTALKTLAKQRGVKVREIGLRIQDLSRPSDVEYLFRTTSTQVAMLLDDEADYIKNSTDNNPTLHNLDVALRRLGMNPGNGANAEIISKGNTRFLKSTLDAANRALRSLSEYFDHHQESLSSSENPLDCMSFNGTSILYLDELDNDEKVMWEMQLVKWLYENKSNVPNTYVFFDEAHQIIPAKPPGSGAAGTFERLRLNFERLAREGRKFGVNLVLATQNPKDLHSIVPEQCPTRIIMKINPRNAKYAYLDESLAMIANQFSHGQFWIQSPFNGTSDWVRVHSMAPAIPHEPMTEFWDKVMKEANK